MQISSRPKRRFKINNQLGFTHSTLILVLLFAFGVFSVARFVNSHASADGPKLYSGLSGYCMEDSKNELTPNTKVTNVKCNDSTAQVWTFKQLNIVHDDSYCLSVIGTNVGLNSCNNGPEQVWLRDNNSYYNPNTQSCLTSNLSHSNSQLTISPCAGHSSPSQSWTPSISTDTTCNGSKGVVVACNAVKQWAIWQSGGSNHEALLNLYTDGAPYEEWCADFVSYIYKTSGYPFTGGESNGWDENVASNIQNMGFTKHLVSSGYIPKPGDVGYFNYNGGHVEIVVSGGKIPTFVYGNSATIDPTTGNGDMMSNTIINDGVNGQVVYYLSPN